MTLAHAEPARPSPLGPILWGVGAFLSVGVALVSYRYLAGAPAPEPVGANRFLHPWLIVHVMGAASALLAAPFQFLPRLRAQRRGLHRLLGRLYVAGCLIGGAGGLMLALGASTGSVSSMGFGALAVLWMVSTALAWRHAVQRRLDEHRARMIRSFALTLAAVTLRLYLPIAMALPFPFEDSYRAISFLSWVPNLLIAELYLRRRSYAV